MKHSIFQTREYALKCLAVGVGFFCSLLAYAQGQEKLIDRFSFGTNAFEWLLTVPNARVEFDILPGPYNRSSVLAGFKFNWNTYHKLPPYYVFNVMDIKAEYRYHFRFSQLSPGEKPNLFSFKRKNPKPWIAYYVGGYTNYSSYAVKFSPKGAQGGLVGLGVSAGLELPLYQYKRGAIDLDLGASAGVIYAWREFFRLNPDAPTSYVWDGKGSIVLPMLAEVRAVFNWRAVSVKNKYVKQDPQIPVFKNALADIQTNFANMSVQSFNDARTKKQAAAHAQSDSLYRADFTAWAMENEKDLLGQISYVQVDESHMKKLQDAVKAGTQKLIAEFDGMMKDKKKEADKAAKAAKADQKRPNQPRKPNQRNKRPKNQNNPKRRKKRNETHSNHTHGNEPCSLQHKSAG